MRPLTYVVSLLVLVSLMCRVDAAVRCSGFFSYERDSADCRVWYRCIWGYPKKMPVCKPGYVFNLIYKVCVEQKSFFDDCTLAGDSASTTTGRPLTIEEKCLTGADVLPKPDNCAQYFNCSQQIPPLRYPGYLGDYVAECMYPDLFDTETNRCRNFEKVKCGSRKEPTYACAYERNLCGGIQCRPCRYRYPNCNNKPDGNQIWENRPWTPYYAKCYKERSVGSGYCEPKNKTIQIFSKASKKCVSIFAVPRAFGGRRPSCRARPTGFYPDQSGRCSVYFVCDAGKFVRFETCGGKRNFDPDTKSCRSPAFICGQCGTRNC